MLAFSTATDAWVGAMAGRQVGPQLVEAAEVLYRQTGIFDDFAVLWQFVTELAWDAGDRAAIQRLFAVMDQDRLNKPSTGLRAQRARLLGLMAAEDGEEPTVVEGHLRTALAEAAAWHSAPMVATCQADLGCWLVRQERVEEAADLLAAARSAYERLGAVRWLEQLDDELAKVTV
jgi:hypothetical protein